MLDARVVVFRDAPAGPRTLPAAPDLHGVTRLLVGFPIWGEGPSHAIVAATSGLGLAGIDVVCFYTYLHAVDDRALAAFEARLRAAGARSVRRLPLRLPALIPDGEVRRRAQRALLALLKPEAAVAAPRCTPGADGVVQCLVPAGRVWLGDNAADDAPAGSEPPRQVRVPAFWMQRSEVTVADYGMCRAAGACPAWTTDDAFCKALIDEHADPGTVPAPCVPYDAAERFCQWRAMRLPDEAQWTRAARADGNASYPWGDLAPERAVAPVANLGEKPATGHPGYALRAPEAPGPDDGVRGLARPCSFAADTNPYGLCDLGGNLTEWVRPAAAVRTVGPILKGGNWMEADAAAMRTAARRQSPGLLDTRSYLVGFRCVREAVPPPGR